MRTTAWPVSVVIALCWVLSLNACGDPQIILPQTLQIVTVAPPHGAIGIGVSVQVAVVFAHPLAPETDLGQVFGLSLFDSGVAVVTTNTLSDDRYSVTLTPAQPLTRATTYVIEIKAGLESSDNQVDPLPSAVRSSFTTS
jgi:hypothetical protein